MLFDSFFSSDGLENRATIDRLENYHKRRFSPVLICLLLGLTSFCFWATSFYIDEVARSSGEVIASSRVQVIQAVDGGVLAQLNVHEGDRVEAGQVLARLDDTRFKASTKEIEARLSALEAKQVRLQAEITGIQALEFSKRSLAYPKLIKVETALFNQRRNGLKEEKRTLRKAMSLAHEELKLLKQLEKTGDSSRSEVIRAESEYNEAESKLIIRQNQFFEDASSELSEVEDDIAQNEQVLTQRQRQLEDSVFVAHMAGIVKNIAVTTVGGVLRSGEELMQIIPVDDELVVEAKVSPVDIAQVRKGLTASLRFDPFDYTIFGSVNGTVVYVSPDTLKEESREGEEIYYRAHIAIPALPVKTSVGRELEILPGMTAQVDIRTGSRTLADFLLKPLRKTLSESFGER